MEFSEVTVDIVSQFRRYTPQRECSTRCRKAIHGTLSGEHGIGIAKEPYMNIAMKEVNLKIMHGIKKAFDPKGILNPGKIF